MLCVKCGEEYEGASCPRCEGPQILVNNDDYLRRRKAYEEKQAAKGSASSDNGDASKTEVDFMVKIANKVNTSRKNMEKKRINKKRKNQEEQDDSDNTFSRTVNKTFAKYMKLIVPAILLVLIAVVFVIILLGDKTKAYVRFEGDIYTVEGEELSLLCTDEDVFFAPDGKRFYKAKLPSEYEGYISDKMASDNGKCFVALNYNNSTAMYSVVLMKEDNAKVVVESAMELDILYVSDQGSIVYTALDVLNDQGYSGAYELYIYEANDVKKPLDGGQIKQITSILNSAYVMVDSGNVLYLDDNGSLNTYDYVKERKVDYVADSVSCVYIMDNDVKDQYSYRTGYVCTREVTAFIYTVGDRCYYADLKNKSWEQTYIGTLTSGVHTLIYKKDKKLYSIDNNRIYVSSMNKVFNEVTNQHTTVMDKKELATVNGGNSVYWNNDSNTMIYVNEAGELCTSVNETSKVLTAAVMSGTLVKVGGSKEGFVYKTAEGWNYMSTLSTKPVLLNVNENLSIKEVVSYNGKLYIVLSDDKLYISNVKGGQLKEINSAEFVWIN